MTRVYQPQVTLTPARSFTDPTEAQQWLDDVADSLPTDVLAVDQQIAEISPPDHLWICGCLRNQGGAHRVGCPVYPEGVRG